MSLTVSLALSKKAASGTLSNLDFLECVRTSLPKAFRIINELTDQAATRQDSVTLFDPKSLDNETRGQLLRMFASDAIRRAIESWVRLNLGDGTRIAFQNCHKVGIFANTELGEREYMEFVSFGAQVLSQRPESVDC